MSTLGTATPDAFDPVCTPRDLVARLDLEQKVRLLTGADFWALNDEPAVGLRRVVTSDGPVGVRGERWDERDSSVNLPSPTSVAATWDRDLVAELGRLLAFEARRKGVDVVLAPTVNLHRSPYGGRHFECLSEDPLLTGDVGSALVSGLQGEGVAATVKHFVANDSETDRLTVDVRVDERTLRELYLAPFEAIVRDAGVWAVMAAYNSVNGSTMTESPMLRQILQDEWGFDGITMTDWYAGRSTVPAARAGLELFMPGPNGPWGEALVRAARAGDVPQETIDDKVERLLRLAARVGALGQATDVTAARPFEPYEARCLVRRAAAAGFVLLRNAGPEGRPVLPLVTRSLRRLAVIGPNSAAARFLGGGSALVFPEVTVSPIDGLVAALGEEVEVTWCQGGRAQERVAPADPRLLTAPDGDAGVEIEFRGTGGEVLGTDRRAGTSFNWNNVFEGVDPALIAEIELRATLRADTAGDYRIGGSGVGRLLMRLDRQTAFDELLELPEGADPVEGLMRPPQQWRTLALELGETVDVSLVHIVRAHHRDEDLIVSLQLNVDLSTATDDEALDHAVAAAAAADVAVVVVGTTEEVESEGFDRSGLALPGRQDELVARVAAAQPETVVVVNAGAPVLTPWRDAVGAIILAWFPGQEFGGALADVLVGDVEPGGRLPTTWPAHEDAAVPTTTPVSGRLTYDEGLHIGYRRFLRDCVEPAYWFGHGLGYTTWSYDELRVEPAAGGAEVIAKMTNTGARAGRQLVQIYVSRIGSAVERPVRWLAGYAWASLAPGETARVQIWLPRRRFEHWHVACGDWTLEPGEYSVHWGASAADVRLEATVTL